MPLCRQTKIQWTTGHNILKWTVLVSIKWANCPVFIIYHACHDPVNNRSMTKNCTWRASTNCKGGGGWGGGVVWDTTLRKTKRVMLVGVEVVGADRAGRSGTEWDVEGRVQGHNVGGQGHWPSAARSLLPPSLTTLLGVAGTPLSKRRKEQRWSSIRLLWKRDSRSKKPSSSKSSTIPLDFWNIIPCPLNNDTRTPKAEVL